MTEASTTPDASATREDKLRAIAALFGEATAQRLGADRTLAAPGAPDADRLAWQTNRLIRHLRDRTGIADTPRNPTQPQARATIPPRPAGPRVPVLAAGEDLAAEHPAVIAHILRHETQAIRVSVLRALPGQVARAVMYRLRMSEQGARPGRP
ncbi:hypothetical protein [Roseicyclus mahoneyensis]|uniref:Uncharacterized protein n=1 Tax=Roseicyclus mahoneyensis TaxID=164332 RepID=A0A316GFQ1_9RHOB|nr:hypothetical protein [Roseicyclus mahoneyensis]PWK59817.1 hypothetical protein C7455_106103 [Roseicyclus mahoneyensis]